MWVSLAGVGTTWTENTTSFIIKMVNAEEYINTVWRCSRCGEFYRFKEVAEQCCNDEEIKKYGK